jgi:hypothetical protein
MSKVRDINKQERGGRILIRARKGGLKDKRMIVKI